MRGMPIPLNDYEKIRELVAAVIGALSQQGSRNGCFVCILDEQRRKIFYEQIGSWKTFFEAHGQEFQAYEAAYRLCEHKDDELSWQSRCDSAQQHQGAVRCRMKGLIVSVTGFTPEENESVALWLSTKLTWLPVRDSYRIAQIADNRTYRRLIPKLEQAYQVMFPPPTFTSRRQHQR